MCLLMQKKCNFLLKLTFGVAPPAHGWFSSKASLKLSFVEQH